VLLLVFFFSSRRRHTRWYFVTGVQTCALPISPEPGDFVFARGKSWIVERAEEAGSVLQSRDFTSMQTRFNRKQKTSAWGA